MRDKNGTGELGRRGKGEERRTWGERQRYQVGVGRREKEKVGEDWWQVEAYLVVGPRDYMVPGTRVVGVALLPTTTTQKPPGGQAGCAQQPWAL